MADSDNSTNNSSSYTSIHIWIYIYIYMLKHTEKAEKHLKILKYVEFESHP